MRKVLILLTIVLICSSCAITGPFYKEQIVSIDYSKYSEDGFFLTESNSVNFEYTPVATLYCIITDGYVKLVEGEEFGIQGEVYSNRSLQWKSGSASSTLDKLYHEAKILGADGIINLSFGSNRASGMAIKRK